MQRPLDQLVDASGSAWPAVQGLLAHAANPARILPATRPDGERTLLALQVSTRSALGAVALECGGVIMDGGWLRLLAAGCDVARGNLLTWNQGASCGVPSPLDGAMIVGHDAAGGFFALDGGLFGREPGMILWRSPETLAWEALGARYPDFLEWCANGDLAHFYDGLRWDGWASDVAAMPFDSGVLFNPTAWDAGPPLGERPRRVVPMGQIWAMTRRDV